MSCIDSHIHIWNFERARYTWLEGNTTILNRDYNIDELEPQVAAAGVTAGILVQAANTEEETVYMLDVAAQTPWLKGVVGWLPLHEPEKVAEIMESGYATNPFFKGVRHLIHDEPTTDWLLQPQVLDSLRLLAAANIPFDVVGILPAHLETVLRLLSKIPELSVVLDHLNQPPIQQGRRFGRWGELFSEVAGHATACAKISGLGTTTGKGVRWSSTDITPAVEFALMAFGPDRCFCGGDWPVSLLAGTYGQTWHIYRETLSALLTETELKKVMACNAVRFYNLTAL